ncbi:hypothetical protein XaraCFBP7407_06075 [Xanthomonas arboricola pv. arracaciae]|nr:hypothetical protein XaraCFBP7407_06075 [Xanthomonas arboricola pv. arracaciae]
MKIIGKNFRRESLVCLKAHSPIFDTPLQAVVRQDLSALYDILLHLPINVTCESALIRACELGFVDAVRMLLPRTSKSAGARGLGCAALGGHMKLVKELLYMDCHCFDIACLDVIEKVAVDGSTEIAQALLDEALRQAPSDPLALSRLLAIACWIGDQQATQRLVEQSGEADYELALFSALEKGHWSCALSVWPFADPIQAEKNLRHHPEAIAWMRALLQKEALQKFSTASQIARVSTRRL